MKNFLLAVGLLLSFQVAGQAVVEPVKKTPNAHQNWFTYFGQYKFSEKWGIHTDVQFRMDNRVQFAKQNLLRAGLIRYLSPNLNLTTGYAYINSHSVGINDYLTEHRIWEQLIYNHKPANLNMTHRLRLEQRFVEKLKLAETTDTETNGYNFGNRLRYFNRTIFNLTRKPEAQQVFYVALQDEVFLNFASPDINKNYFDQNRFLLALGVFHDKKTRLELGYMNQYLNPASGNNFMNHIVHVSVLQTLNFSSTE